MKPITDIGQAEIKLVGKSYFLNPSFLAMTRIGTPEEIVDALVCVNGGHYPQHTISNAKIAKDAYARSFARMIKAASTIVQACCDEDLTHLLGGYAYTPKGKIVMRKGFMPLEDIITLAQHLSWHGVIGDQQRDENPAEGEYSPRFDARSFVYMAVAHLSMSESDAWNMTMTSFRAAMAAKFPQKEKPKIPSQKTYDDTMDWADRIMKQDADRKKPR